MSTHRRRQKATSRCRTTATFVKFYVTEAIHPRTYITKIIILVHVIEQIVLSSISRCFSRISIHGIVISSPRFDLGNPVVLCEPTITTALNSSRVGGSQSWPRLILSCVTIVLDLIVDSRRFSMVDYRPS